MGYSLADIAGIDLSAHMLSATNDNTLTIEFQEMPAQGKASRE